ncbi:MBL fold metallo-hydrolase RNA specificity domain-containing protein [Anatilimnocola floriformis]|uniref:MBL fold metallo-hydrolase RNA specificity domain-containing protein n=1 Tax=Anatilimnocola floriformis TaxID=2948575 RepID=UPI0020C27175|nr:MBL fold metallo-hydrolase [Anatilimnocola floriformis]
MKLHFLGANRQVTGSRYCLETEGRELLIDCGLFQERQFQDRNWDPCPIPAERVDAMLLTHVHIDHSGLIPRFVREGFAGPIHCTRPTAALVEIMLRDAAKIQTEDADYKKKRHARENRRGRFAPEPLYVDEDVDRCVPLFREVHYNQPQQIFPNVRAIFHDAGHILGSAMITLEVTENGQMKRLVFSGDIGQWNKPIIQDPTLLVQADYLVMETTYGDRLHPDAGDVESQLADVINTTIGRGGKVIIPTFALERAQELMYHFARLVRANRIPNIKVFMDSPMAVDVTAVFERFREYYDDEMRALITGPEPPLRFPGLTMVRSTAESKKINEVREPCVIMASAGMCNAGRIKHHLRQNISNPANTILFVGHQSYGTLGHHILSGAPFARIHGQDFRVAAKIAQVYGLSGHADRNGLLKWLTHFEPKPKRVFFTHGEEAVALAFAEHAEKQLGHHTYVPHYQEAVELT